MYVRTYVHGIETYCQIISIHNYSHGRKILYIMCVRTYTVYREILPNKKYIIIQSRMVEKYICVCTYACSYIMVEKISPCTCMYVRTWYIERYNRPQIMYMFLSCIYLQASMDMISNESPGVVGLPLNVEGIKGRSLGLSQTRHCMHLSEPLSTAV